MAEWRKPCFVSLADLAAVWLVLQKLYGRRFKNADFWETLAKAREAVRLLPYLLLPAFPKSSHG